MCVCVCVRVFVCVCVPFSVVTRIVHNECAQKEETVDPPGCSVLYVLIVYKDTDGAEHNAVVYFKVCMYLPLCPCFNAEIGRASCRERVSALV